MGGRNPRPERPAATSFLSAVLGGLVVVILGAVLVATDVVDVDGGERTVIRGSAAQPAPVDGSGDARSIGDLYRREGPGVVLVEARNVSDDSPFGVPSQRGASSGSGFVLDREGFILTNAHVVEGSQDVRVRFGQRGEPVEATVKGRDPSSDLAVLKVDPGEAKLNPIPLGDSSKVQVGDPVLAIGNPFGLRFDRTVTSGIVSAIQRSIEAPNGFTITGAIQTDASINPGNSGGPLIDMKGRVIGINSQIATSGGGGSVGIGFAVPVNLAKQAIPRLKRGARVERAYIGVTSTEVTEQLADEFKLPVDRGALVAEVRPGSPARKAGLRGATRQTTGGLRVVGGDLIVRAGGKAVTGPDDLIAAIQEKRPGDTLEIEYFRRGDRRKAELELTDRPAGGQRRQEPPGLLVP